MRLSDFFNELAEAEAEAEGDTDADADAVAVAIAEAEAEAWMMVTGLYFKTPLKDDKNRSK